MGSTNYYVSQTINGCEGPRATLTVTINPLPNAPLTNNISYCQNATAQPLQARGQNLRWYTTASGGEGSGSLTPSTATPGSTTYYVNQTDNNGCESSGRATLTVFVNPLPNAPTVVSKVSYCQNATAQPLQATGRNLRWYTAASGGEGSGSLTPSTATPGYRTYYVSQTDNNSCESERAPVVVVISPAPSAPTVSKVSYCQGTTGVPPLTATGGRLTFYAAASGGEGSGSLTPSTATPGGTTYYVSQTDNNGCESERAEITVNINVLPAVSITGLASAYCQDATGQFLTGSPIGGLFTIDGVAANSVNPTTLSAGQHTVVYSVTNASGCSASASQNMSINAIPVVSISPSATTVCAGQRATLTASDGLVSYRWSTGQTSQSISVSLSGTYAVTATNGAECSSVASVSVSQDNTVPLVSLVSNDTLNCGVTVVMLTASPGGARYVFSEGATPLSTGNQAVVSQAGLYSVTVLAGNGCSATASTTVQSNTAAVFITAPAVGTATVGLAVSQSFTASGGTSPYSYSLASGSLPAGLSLAAEGTLSGTPTQSGRFPLTVKATDANSCSAVSAAYVLTVSDTVSPTPTLSGLTASPEAVCVGSPVAFTAMVGNLTGSYSYTLTNSLGTSLSGTASGTSFSQSVTASGTGTQTFTLTVGANGQSAASGTALTVSPLPVASLINNGPLSCAQPSVTLTASGASGVPVNSYTFTSGSGVIGTPGAVNTMAVSSPGTYSVTVANANGCLSSTSTVVTIDQNVPTVSISPSSATLSCASPRVSLTAVGTGGVRWSTGETSSTISVSTAGPYSVTLTSTNGCASVASVSVSQDNSAPVASLVSSGSLTCSVTSVTLTAGSNGQRYTFSQGATPISSSNQVVVDAAGVYSVTVVSANGCSAVASTTVVDDQNVPAASLTNNGPLSCSVTSVTLTASGTGTYRFERGANQVGDGATAIVSTAGVYSVTVTGANGCTATAQTTVEVNTIVAAPILTASVLSTENEPISVTASGCSGSLTWTAIGGIGTANGSMYTVTQPGNYTLTATCMVGSCTSPAAPSLSLQIRPGGFAIRGVELVRCELLDAGRGQYEISFTPLYSGLSGSPVSFSVTNELAATTAPGPYTLRLYTDNAPIGLVASQNQAQATYRYHWLAACRGSQPAPNRPPMAQPIPDQVLVVGQNYQLDLSSYFTDSDGQTLSFTAKSLPAGLQLSGNRISGSPTQVGTTTVQLTALDPGGLQAVGSVLLRVDAAPVTPTPGVFSIAGVTGVRCETVTASERQLIFSPVYTGLTGEPISFGITNELATTTAPGPYTIRLYTDNPAITLTASQNGTQVSYRYSWLAACTTPTNGRQAVAEANSPLTVVVLGNPIVGESVEVLIGGVDGQAVELSLTDLAGNRLYQQSIRQAANSDRVTLPVSTRQAITILKVNTATQQQTVKLIRP